MCEDMDNVESAGAEVPDCRGGKPSASGMQRIALCPGSWLAERGLPDESGEAAEMGTRLHRHLELGTLPEDAEEVEAVVWCLEMERRLADKYVLADVPACREVRWWDVARSFSGQADVVFANGGVALVLDYKFGRGAVPVANGNLQLAALALLCFDNMPEVGVVLAGILQPFVSRQVPGLVRFRRADLLQLRQYFRGLLAQAERKDAPRVPGVAQCRYCKARVSCAVCMALVQQQSAVSVAEAWADWSPEKKAEALRVAGLARRWAEAVERRARADLKEGFPIPGFALSAGKSAFRVSDARGAFEHLNGLIGLSAGEFAGCCSVRISDLDKVVHKRLVEMAPEGSKQLVKVSRVWLRDALGEFGATSVSEGCIKVC